MFNWKNIFKSWAGVPVLILAILAVLWLVSQWTPLFNSEARRVKKLAEEIERPYREDRYGGKTPEETYDLFISALKAENIELASKYFETDKQDEWYKVFEEYKQNSSLITFINETEENRKNWKVQEATNGRVIYLYSYAREKPEITELPVSGGKTQKITLPTGTFYTEARFYKNVYTNIWKIEFL